MQGQFKLVHNAVIVPLRGTMDSFTAGVFDNGICLPESLMHRCTAAQPEAPRKRLPGAYIYGGFLFGHYGHFLLESLSRLYAIRRCAELPLLFSSPNEFIATWQLSVLKLFGLDKRVQLVTEPVEAEQLIVSPPGATVLPDSILPQQLEALGSAVHSTPEPDRKIWLSRSAFPYGGVVENEAEIERNLQEMGWEIVHPEQLPIAAQARSVASARVVAGFDGSAFFSGLLANKIHGTLLIFNRRHGIAPTVSFLLDQKGARKKEFLLPLDPSPGFAVETRCTLRSPQGLLAELRAY